MYDVICGVCHVLRHITSLKGAGADKTSAKWERRSETAVDTKGVVMMMMMMMMILGNFLPIIAIKRKRTEKWVLS